MAAAAAKLTTATLATTFKALHKPGNPLLLANVYDLLSAETIASLPSSHALATASFAVARANGVTDDELSFETNLAAVQAISKVTHKHGKPLTVDFQDGYGSKLTEAVGELIATAGVVGVNLEDYSREKKGFYSVGEAAGRIKSVLGVAREKGVADFVVNARCDVLMHGGELEEVITRGKTYLEAGATSVFVLGGAGRAVSQQDIERLVGAFDGRLNVALRIGAPGALTVEDLSRIGVARISVGPQIQFAAVNAITDAAKKLLEGK